MAASFQPDHSLGYHVQGKDRVILRVPIRDFTRAGFASIQVGVGARKRQDETEVTETRKEHEMKRIFTLTAAALIATAGAAAAMTEATSVNVQEIRGYAPNADVSALSNADINALLGIIHGGDGEGEKARTVRAYLLNVQ